MGSTAESLTLGTCRLLSRVYFSNALPTIRYSTAFCLSVLSACERSQPTPTKLCHKNRFWAGICSISCSCRGIDGRATYAVGRAFSNKLVSLRVSSMVYGGRVTTKGGRITTVSITPTTSFLCSSRSFMGKRGTGRHARMPTTCAFDRGKDFSFVSHSSTTPTAISRNLVEQVSNKFRNSSPATVESSTTTNACWLS